MPTWESIAIIGIAVIGAVVSLWGTWWLWWRLPKRHVARLALKIRDPKARADVEDNFRKTVGQALGGAAVLIGAAAAYMQFTQQQRAAHDLLISNQIAKGFEQLGADKLATRFGGIYGLEGVMKTSEEYQQPVLDALCAFVRESTKSKTDKTASSSDIQAILSVIGRRANRAGYVNLTGAKIPYANLQDADFSGAYLREVQLHGANMIGANLRDAYFLDAQLTNTHLSDAHLEGALLFNANMEDADLRRIPLVGGVHNDGAHLNGAELVCARLVGAHLLGAHLDHARLDGADLTSAEISQDELDHACGADAKLPPDLTLKPCPKAKPFSCPR
jgi:uncharacterized protein YjbI with pentapeptide repeats